MWHLFKVSAFKNHILDPCAWCRLWPPLLRFFPSPTFLPPSLSQPGRRSVACRRLPDPSLNLILTSVPPRRPPFPVSRPSPVSGGGLEETEALQLRRETTRRPSAPQQDRSIRRRHGDEADPAHLLGSHAACGGFGFQWHHSLRLFLNQRLQRW